MNDRMITFFVLSTVGIMAFVGLMTLFSEARKTGNVPRDVDLKELIADRQDYAYTRRGYQGAHGIPPQTVRRDPRHIPSLIPKTERIEPIPFKGLTIYGPSFVTPERNLEYTNKPLGHR